MSDWVHDYYLVGVTRSNDFPLEGALQASCVAAGGGTCDETAFLSVLTQTRDQTVTCCPLQVTTVFEEGTTFSSYLGGPGVPVGTGDNHAVDVALMDWDHILMAGHTGSGAFPLVDPLPGSTSASSGGVFAMRLSPVPEPSVSALFASGVLTLLGLGRRRRVPGAGDGVRVPAGRPRRGQRG